MNGDIGLVWDGSYGIALTAKGHKQKAMESGQIVCDTRYFNRTEPTIPLGEWEYRIFHCRGFGCGLGEDCPMPDNCHEIMFEPIEDEV